MKRVVSVLLAFILLISAVPMCMSVSAANITEFAGGSGTENDPYLILTKAHLNNVRNYLSAHFKMTADIEFADEDFAEGGDFYNDGQGWAPIGTDFYIEFTGVFDGDGHTIKNLYINPYIDISSPWIVYAGLFGYNEGTIKNLGLVDGEVSASSSDYNAYAYAGGIAGDNSGTIENCYNMGVVSASASAYDDAYAYAGGIVGSNSGTITDCYNTGEVTASSYDDDVSYAGGIAGFNYYGGTITNCYNTGEVSALSDYIALAGGIVGRNNEGTVQNCYNTGEVSASSDDYYAYAGGIVGENDWGSTIENCYNMGVVSASALASSYYFAHAYAGGIVGENDWGSTIENCYNTGAVSASISSYDKTAYAGGIAGGNDGTIQNCYNTGEVSASAYDDSRAYAGGIVGYKNGTITNCYYLNTASKGVGSGTDTTTKCTAEELKQLSTFVGFDFENVWTMEGDKCYPYPELKNITFTSGHIFDNACDTDCACGYVRSTTHSYGKYVYNNDATTKKDGTKTRVCKVCGDRQTVTAIGTKWVNPFGDVKKNDFYYDAVLWAVNNGVTSGTSPTTFAPNETCTRGQVVTFLWRAAGSPTPKTSKNPFTDIHKKDYYYKAVLWAVEKGITDGYTKTTFAPERACTRGQVATFLYRAEGSPSVKDISNPFRDVKKNDFYYKAVLWAVKEGITKGTSKTTFGPNETCTRGQIATFLYRNYK